MVIINGEKADDTFIGMTVKDFLIKESYNVDRIVVERNLEIIPKDELDKVIIEDNDTIEVLNFVGGGWLLTGSFLIA